MAAINKNFVIKNGIEVGENLIYGDKTNLKVGIGTTVPNYTLDDGIQELIKSYQVLIPRMTSEFRNGFPLGYANQT